MIGFKYEKEPIIKKGITGSKWETFVETLVLLPTSIYDSYKPVNKIAWGIRGLLMFITFFIWFFLLFPISMSLIVGGSIMEEITESYDESIVDK